LRWLSPLQELGALSERFFELSPSVKRPVLFLGAILIIVMPALLYNMAAQAAYEAATWVSHSSAVKNQVNLTLYDLRDGEAAARFHLLLPTPQAHANFDAAMARLDGDLVALRNLTLDNPRQQERIGQLRFSLEGRRDALRHSLALAQAGHSAAAIQEMHRAVESYPFREVSQEMVTEEEGLLQNRIRAAAHKQRIAGLLLCLSSAAQFLLLGTIYLVSEKDARLRREAEAQANAAAAQARSVVESNPDPLAVLDDQGHIEDANQAFCALYRISRADARGRLLREVGDGAWDIAELHQRLLDLVPRQREIWDLEITQHLDGEERYILVNARSFSGPGDRRMILFAAKDVTARHRTEEHIVRLNQELTSRVEQAHTVNEELEAFSYSVSHDLRAPLRHITGFADMLRNHLSQGATPPDEKTTRYLKYIVDSAHQMGSLIDDLLVFSRMGRSEMVGEEVDMEALAREAVHHFALETEGRKVDVQIARLPSALGDAAMLRLVWMNLVGNAVKYTRAREEARIEIGFGSGEGKETVYFVRDNGVGFNMKYSHKLFGVFQRLHQADEYEGTGIGLANVRRIVQRHGGRVWAEGEIDKGATFSFSLPPEPPLRPSPAFAPTPQLRSRSHLSQLARPESTALS
jgi:PAS domain S-box-containing protein